MTGRLIIAGTSLRPVVPESTLRAWIEAAAADLAATIGSVLAASVQTGLLRPAARTERRGGHPTLVAQAPPPKSGASFHEIVLPHLDAAYNLARFLTRDADAADDIVQDAFLRAFRAFDGFRGGDPRAWLLAIVRNCARSWASERARTRALSEPLPPPQAEDEAEAEALEVPDPLQATPEAALLRDSEARLVRRLIEALPEAFREVLVMREFDDLSYRQIAEITATPIGTVMSRLARARQMIGAAWRRQDEAARP
ncbi:RNA polymerase sigma-70 factor (ECF subfamily) [Methylobacterium sp. BE186]|uniref:sigma-70 family RNA polymerase sigma factor n=1 Tax=Methylobacterium sp. BE186 TaxID=2817715 RepID=UPI002865FFF3|nr:sigma-70 family RNA polymerase sigma factor [Methylobacterium sp. BE186]MDR7039610.1 RNA polymerase sigma-70 factor (ECF subfamily) [Methylobacterium sp. BE186]